MAKTKVFIGTDTPTCTVSDAGIEIYGSTGTADKVVLNSTATGVTLASTIERFELSDAIANYKFVATAGTGLVIQTSAGVTVGTIGSLDQTTKLAFTDGSVDLVQTGATGFTVGGQTVNTTTATAVTGATITASDTSTVGVIAGQTFTLTTAADISGVITGSLATTSVLGNDTFTATGNGGATATYNTGDVINGGTGNDILNLALTATNTGLATVVGVETINVSTTSFAAVTFDATNVSAVGSTINLSNAQLAGTTNFTVSNLGTGSTVAAGTGVTGTLTIGTTAATSQTLTVAANANVNSLAVTTGAAATQTLTIGAFTAAAPLQTIVMTHSGATDVGTISAVGTVNLTATTIETLNFSGNGGAVTYTMASTLGATANNITGSQSVTLKGSSASFTGLTITDSGSAGTSTINLSTVAGDTDLKNATVDMVTISGVAGATAFTVKSGQAVTVSAINTGDDTFSINNGDTTYVDGSLTATLTVLHTSGNGLTVAANSATADNITTLNIVNNTVAQTALDLLATATCDVVISGTKAVTLEATSTAKSISATALTAALTMTFDGTADVKTVTGGSGNDVFNITGTSTSTINGGVGVADSVVFDATQVATGVTLSNIELINLDGGADGSSVIDFKASQLSGKTYVITGQGANDSITINDALSIDTTTIDLSGLVINSTDVTSITILGTAKSADYGANTALTITGSSVADTITGDAGADTISGGGGIDTIVGGGGADTITGGEGADVITGGAGNDSIVLTETTAAIDKIVFLGGATAAAALTADGRDAITGWGSTDTLNVAALGDTTNQGKVATTTADISVAAAAGAFTTWDDKTIVISTNGTAANLTTGGTKTVTDWTNMTQVAQFLSERFTSALNSGVIVINNTTTGANTSYVYDMVDSDATATSLVAADISLLSVISNGGTALVGNNIVVA